MDNSFFTIKQVIKDPYNPAVSRVRLWPARNVTFGVHPDLANGSEEPHNPPNLSPHVFFEMPDGTNTSIDAGVIFVMNSNGKTVDTYRLKGSEWY